MKIARELDENSTWIDEKLNVKFFCNKEFEE